MKIIVKAGACFFYFATLGYIFFLAKRRQGPALPWHKRNVNLIPLKKKIEYIIAWPDFTGPAGRDFYIDLFGNILLFIPFTFFLVFVLHIQSLRRIILVTFVTSVSIELIQLIFSIGVADIDDIILNVSGAVIGYFILKFLFKMKACKLYFNF